jgi:2OG-Fe(II) oxygenase superfamily
MIRPEVMQEASEHARAFRDAQPFKYVVLDGFLEPMVSRRLLDEFPSFEDRHALNEMGQVGGKAVRMDVRDVSDTYRSVDRYLQTREFLDYVSTVTGIPDLLYDPDYVGGGTHENRDGQRLEQHVDFNFHPGTRWHRRLNLIVYLNPGWDDAWGGALELQTDPWQGDTRGPRIAPLFNRAVIFETTEKSWHGFSQISLPVDRKSLSRKSFAIYLYTRERPQEETAASHATVYVPDTMPKELHAGKTLTDADIMELTARFGRLRGQLKFLYDREKEFATQLAASEAMLGETRDSIRMPLQGYVTQSAAPQGLSPDGWVAQDFHVEFVPTKKAAGIVLEAWAPQRLDDNQSLQIDMNGKRWEHHIARGSHGKIELKANLDAGANVELSIRAGKTFNPARVGESGDTRDLAWKLLDAWLI